MKKLLLSAVVLLAFSAAVIVFQMSCSKSAEASPPTTLTKEQILVQKTWQVDKLMHVISNQYSSYTRGGTNTTGTTYDALRFTFNANGTGTHITDKGVSMPFTWQLATDKRSMTFVDAVGTYTWDMVEIADNYFHASVRLSISGNSDNNLESFRLVQIP